MGTVMGQGLRFRLARGLPPAKPGTAPAAVVYGVAKQPEQQGSMR